MRSITLILYFFLLILFASLGVFGQESEKENDKEALLENLKLFRDVESFSYQANSTFKYFSYSENDRDSLYGRAIVHRDPGDTVFGARFRGGMTRVRKANSDADTTRTKVHYDGDHLLTFFYSSSSGNLIIYQAADAEGKLSHFSKLLKIHFLNPSYLLERSANIEMRGGEEIAESPFERFQFLLKSENTDLEPFYKDWSFSQDSAFPVRMKDSTRHEGMYQKQDLRVKEFDLNKEVKVKIRKLAIDSGDPETYSAAVEVMAPENMSKDSIDVEYFDPSEDQESKEERRARLNSVDPAPPLKGLPFPFNKGNDSTLLEAPFDSKLLLLDFWYMDCAPCRRAIPYLNKLHKEYGEQGLRIVGVDPVDEAERMKERWSNFSEHNPIDYEILLTGWQAADRYKIRSYPTFFLLNDEGELLMAKQGFYKEHMEGLEEKLQEHLE